jgi:hypothetical protein
VSEIIAALLVVCITVSAGTLFAAYASGLMGRILNPVTSQPYTEQFSVEYYNWNTLSSLIVDVRNTGVATVNLATADYYLSGIKLTTAPTFSCVSPATSTAVAPVGVCNLTWSLTAGSYSSGIAYVLKIVLTDGTTFTFSLIAGSNTH